MRICQDCGQPLEPGRSLFCGGGVCPRCRGKRAGARNRELRLKHGPEYHTTRKAKENRGEG